MPDSVFLDGFSDPSLKVDLESQGFVVTEDVQHATYIIFAEDPNRRRYRLPPRPPFGATRADVIKNIRKLGIKRGWK